MVQTLSAKSKGAVNAVNAKNAIFSILSILTIPVIPVTVSDACLFFCRKETIK